MKTTAIKPLAILSKKAASPKHQLTPASWIVDHREYLENFARGKVNDSALAEDLVQETFLSAWKGRKGFRGDCAERTWLVGVLRNKIIDHYRSAARRPVVREADVAPNDERDGGAGWIAALPDESPASDPIVLAEQREFMTDLDRAINRLPEAAGTAFRMREIEGYSTQEITDKLNITSGNLWVLIHRAKTALREQMEMSRAA